MARCHAILSGGAACFLSAERRRCHGKWFAESLCVISPYAVYLWVRYYQVMCAIICCGCGCESVCMCVSVCVCVGGGGESERVCWGGGAERECVCEKERERVCVCVKTFCAHLKKYCYGNLLRVIYACSI